MLTADAEASQDRPSDEASRRLSWLFAVPVALFVLGDLDTSFVDREWSWAGRDLTALRVVLFVVLAGVSAATAWWPNRVAGRVLSAPVAVFLAWAALASLAGVHPARSMVSWLVLAAAACAGAVAVRRAGDRAALTAIWVGAVALAIVSIGLDQTSVLDRVQSRLAGPTLEPNMVAHICGLGVVALGLTVRRQTLERMILALPMLYVIYASDTRTIMVALAVAAGASTLVRSPRSTVVAGAVVAVLFISFDVGASFQSAAQRTGDEDLSELSGRIGVWQFSLERIDVDPFTGSGLASGPREFDQHAAASDVQVASQSSHSLPLEIARETGVVGLGLAVIASALALWRRRWSLLPLTAYLVVSALTMPMSGFSGLVTVAWFVVITPPASLDTRAQDVT